MHPTLSLGMLAFVGLQGCVIYVDEPPPRRPHHSRPHSGADDPSHGGGGGGDSDPEEEEDAPDWSEAPAMAEGRWIFALSHPESVGAGCALDDDLQALTVEGQVRHLGPSTIAIVTDLATLEGEVQGDQVLASGLVRDGEVRGEIWLSATLEGPTRLYGQAEGEGGDCFLRADLSGYALSE